MQISRWKTTENNGDGAEVGSSKVRRGGIKWLGLLLPVALGVVAFFCLGIRGRSVAALSSSVPEAETPVVPMSTGSSPIFKPGRQRFLESLREYFQLQPTPVQPIAFTHRLHLQNGMQCVSCHTGVTEGPDAGIPSVTFCMACHQEVAKDKPEIKKLTAYADKEQDVPWWPVYWFYPSEHVRFQHAPHIRAGVDCQECHGDMALQTVAVRSKNLNMNFCISCHREKGASADCTTCHY